MPFTIGPKFAGLSKPIFSATINTMSMSHIHDVCVHSAENRPYLALGNLSTDPRDPNGRKPRSICAPPDVIPKHPPRATSVSFVRMTEITKKGELGAFASFAGGELGAGLSGDSILGYAVLADTVHVYAIQDPEFVFLEMMKYDDVRKWVKERQAKDIYMVTGLIVARTFKRIVIRQSRWEAAIKAGFNEISARALFAFGKERGIIDEFGPQEDGVWPILGFQSQKVPARLYRDPPGGGGSSGTSNVKGGPLTRLRRRLFGKSTQDANSGNPDPDSEWENYDYGKFGITLSDNLFQTNGVWCRQLSVSELV